MALFLCLALFLMLAAGITVYGHAYFVKPANMLQQLATSTSEIRAGPVSSFDKITPAVGLAKLFSSIGNLLPSSPQESSHTASELTAAGIRASYAVSVYAGIKLLSCVVLVLMALYLRVYITDSPVGRLAIPAAAGCAGYIAPGFILGRLIKKRRQQLRLSLPDVLDLLVISTEAGCALDKAILNVSREFKLFHPAISEELTLVNMEMLAGSSRMDALRNLAKRTGEDEIKKLVAIMIQTDRFGTSVAEALRTQSEFMRVRRRQEAEERAGKVGVKLVFPIFFFCMPALTIIVAGPGMLQLFNNLLPAMSNMK